MIDAIRVSFADALQRRLRHSVDVVIFNPPYVPTATEESMVAQGSQDIRATWAGGVDGMEVTNTFLQVVQQLMSPNGRFYLVALKNNDIAGIRQKMLCEYGLRSDIVLERRAGREHLFIIRFTRDSN
ncbi:hypothetical protein AX17_000574 [Amanita inopinata Kibby_2008]|nr:hypothetical protein AX17_000574 [Amanita inopinata Kibby_2008]